MAAPIPAAPRIMPLSAAARTAVATMTWNPIIFQVQSSQIATSWTTARRAKSIITQLGIVGKTLVMFSDPRVYENKENIKEIVMRASQIVRNVGRFTNDSPPFLVRKILN